MARETKIERALREQEEETARQVELAKWKREELPSKMLYVAGKANELGVRCKITPTMVTIFVYDHEFDTEIDYTITTDSEKWEVDHAINALEVFQQYQEQLKITRKKMEEVVSKLSSLEKKVIVELIKAQY